MNIKAILLIVALALILPSCGQGDKKDSLSSRAGKNVGETLTDFAKGVGSGVDEQMKVEVAVSQELLDAGFTKTAAKSLSLDGKKKGITVYLISKAPFTGTLLAKALDKDGQEIGRSKVDVTFDKEDAKYVSFKFETEMETALVQKYEIIILK